MGSSCGGARGPERLEVLMHEDAPRAPLPDRAERHASELAEFAFAGRTDEAALRLLRLREIEAERRERGEPGTGLADNAEEMLAAMAGEDAYTDFAEKALENDDIDPLLRRRLESHLEQQPLARAEQHRRDHLRFELAALFNRLSGPLSSLAFGGVLAPIESGRAAISSLLVTRSLDPISTHERQALRDYEEFLERDPDAPEAPEAKEMVVEYREELRDHLRDEALEFAERAIAAGQPEVAIAHLERAERLGEQDELDRELWSRAYAQVERRESALRRSYHAEDEARGDDALAAESFLSRALLLAPEEAAERARDMPVPESLEDERAFLEAFSALARGDEDDFHDRMEEIAELDPAEYSMARHARAVLRSPDQSPYDAYRRAVSHDRGERTRWLLFGRHAHGPADRDLPAPLEWLLDAPGIAVSFVTFPQRLLQYSSARSQFGSPVIQSGERYLTRYPDGVHAEEVHRELESLYAARQHWLGAYQHHSALAEPDPETSARYREQIAERALESAELQPRIDVRMSIYRQVALEYPETPQAARAEAALLDLVENSTPQHIRVSRAFLEENPEVWQPAALGLRPELFDGDVDNGELAEDGVTLIGQTAVSLALEDREPLLERVPEQNFARFVALLEETSYRRLLTDDRERPEPDPQRDLFFERARLHLLDEADMRPAASSHALFLGSQEKHGLIRRRDSFLPIEFVLQGGVDSFGLSAFPRLKPPAEDGDDFLYR